MKIYKGEKIDLQDVNVSQLNRRRGTPTLRIRFYMHT